MTKYDYLFKGNKKLKERDIILLNGKNYVILGFELFHGMGGSRLSAEFLNVFYVEESKYLSGIKKDDVYYGYLNQMLGYKIIGSKEQKEFSNWLMKLKLTQQGVFKRIETREDIRKKVENADIKVKYTLIEDKAMILVALMLAIWGIAMVVKLSQIAKLNIIFTIIGVAAVVLFILNRVFNKEKYETKIVKKRNNIFRGNSTQNFVRI